MPSLTYSTHQEYHVQEPESCDDWTKEVLPRLPSDLQAQAEKLKAFSRSRKVRSASDLLRGLLAYVYTAHSFEHLSMWSVLIGLADVSANDWRKRLRQASTWLCWLLQTLLAMSTPLSPWLLRGGLRRVLLIDGTHWKCVGAKGMVWRVHTAFDLLAGRLCEVHVTDTKVGEKLEVFALQKGDLAVTDRANGVRARIVYVLSQMADIIVRIGPSRFPMENEKGEPINLLEWLKSLGAAAGAIRSREVWIKFNKKRIRLRLVALRLSEGQQAKAERRTKRKASKNQQKLQEATLYYAGWVLVVTTLPQEGWRDQHIMQLYQARWQIELLFKRIKQLLQLHTLRCKTKETATATITALLVGWALLEQESTQIRQEVQEAVDCVEQVRLAALQHRQMEPQAEEMADPLSEWTLTVLGFDLLTQQIRGSYTRQGLYACLPRLQRFLGVGHRKRAHLYTEICSWLRRLVPELSEEMVVAT